MYRAGVWLCLCWGMFIWPSALSAQVEVDFPSSKWECLAELVVPYDVLQKTLRQEVWLQASHILSNRGTIFDSFQSQLAVLATLPRMDSGDAYILKFFRKTDSRQLICTAACPLSMEHALNAGVCKWAKWDMIEENFRVRASPPLGMMSTENGTIVVAEVCDNVGGIAKRDHADLQLLLERCSATNLVESSVNQGSQISLRLFPLAFAKSDREAWVSAIDAGVGVASQSESVGGPTFGRRPETAKLLSSVARFILLECREIQLTFVTDSYCDESVLTVKVVPEEKKAFTGLTPLLRHAGSSPPVLRDDCVFSLSLWLDGRLPSGCAFSDLVLERMVCVMGNRDYSGAIREQLGRDRSVSDKPSPQRIRLEAEMWSPGGFYSNGPISSIAGVKVEGISGCFEQLIADVAEIEGRGNFDVRPVTSDDVFSEFCVTYFPETRKNAGGQSVALIGVEDRLCVMQSDATAHSSEDAHIASILSRFARPDLPLSTLSDDTSVSVAVFRSGIIVPRLCAWLRHYDANAVVNAEVFGHMANAEHLCRVSVTIEDHEALVSLGFDGNGGFWGFVLFLFLMERIDNLQMGLGEVLMP